MSKRRNSEGRFAKRASPKLITGMWLASLASIGLLYVLGTAVMNMFGSFRSCDANNTGLTILSCGKKSLNIMDVALIGLLVASAVLVVTLLTGAWRVSRRATV